MDFVSVAIRHIYEQLYAAFVMSIGVIGCTMIVLMALTVCSTYLMHYFPAHGENEYEHRVDVQRLRIEKAAFRNPGDVADVAAATVYLKEEPIESPEKGTVDVQKPGASYQKSVTTTVNVPRRETTVVPAIHVDGGTEKFPCDVPCYWPKTQGGIVRNVLIDEIQTSVTMSMEGEAYYPSLKLEHRKEKHIIASTRFDSDIPMPYFNWPWTLYLTEAPNSDDIWSHNDIQTPHVPLSDVKKAGVFIARNCHSKSNREALVKSLMALMPVDSVSSCLHNFDLADTAKKIPMMRKYAFYFAFENQRIDDYITEKLWDTFRAGVLPVYFGAPNIQEHVPSNSIVHVDDFTSVDALAQHLKAILRDPDLYNSYHTWRYKPLPRRFVAKYNFTHVHSQCRVCRWASAKLRGLGWNPQQQQIVQTPPASTTSAESLDHRGHTTSESGQTLAIRENHHDELAIVRTSDDSLHNEEFFLYLPKNAPMPEQSTLDAFMKSLKENLSIDVVGGFVLTEKGIEHTCFDIEICHWTLLHHYEYRSSDKSYMQCDTTSNVFVARRKWRQHLDFKLGTLTPIDFFITVKQNSGKVVTDVSQILRLNSERIPRSGHESFVRKHGIDQIRNRYTGKTIDLCNDCDAHIMRDILNGKSWNHYGMSMPNFAYAAYVNGFQKAIDFLNKHDMVYRLYGGAHLGLFKLGRLLPWDAGDVDIFVDVSSLGCEKWLALLKQWADDNGFIHPHTDPAGRKCGNYGVYAMRRGLDVRDPFSLGLISFMGHKSDHKIVPTTSMHAHGVDAHVSRNMWDTLTKKYDVDILSHKKHVNYGNTVTQCQHRWKHNCILDTVGTHLDTCIEYTQFYNI